MNSVGNRVQDIYGLSPMQRELFLAAVRSPDSYVVQFSCNLEGPLDEDAFEAAWSAVVENHPVLRTTFHMEGLDTPVQVVHRFKPTSINRVDMRSIAHHEQQLKISLIRSKDRRLGFNLARGPLMRLTLIRISNVRALLLWTYHHIILDGWSMVIVLRQFLQAYHSRVTRRECRIVVPRPYRDFIAWLQRQNVGEALNHWREELRGFNAPTRIDLGPPGNQRANGQVDIRLNAEETSSMVAFARSNSLTLNGVLQGGWAMLLALYSDSSDIVFGTTVSGRPGNLDGVEEMTGLFANTLPVRIVLDYDSSVIEWLRGEQLRQAQLRSFDFCTLEEIRSVSEVPRPLPLFETALVVENYPAGAPVDGMDHLRASGFETSERVPFSLALVALPGAELLLRLLYAPEQFSGSAVERLSAHLREVIDRIIHGRSAKVRDLCSPISRDSGSWRSKLPPLSGGGCNRNATELKDVQDASQQEMCMHQLFEAQVQRTPDAVAVKFEDRHLSYCELNQRANQLAHFLRARGLGPEMLVGLYLEKSPEAIVALLAVLKAGAAYLPLDPSYPAERLRWIIDDSRIAMLLTQQGSREIVPQGQVTLLCLDSHWNDIAHSKTDNPNTGVSVKNLAYVIYTSGSTGKPKGVMIEHRGLYNVAQAQLETFGVHPQNRILQFASLSFDAAIWEVMMALCAGATLVLARRERLLPGLELLRLLREEGITHVTLPPSVLALLPDNEPLPALTTLIAAGEACAANLVNRWAKGRLFYNAYGPTETTVCATIALCESDCCAPPIGRPLRNTQVYVLDQNLEISPVGFQGEMYVGGAGLARGYWNDPSLTLARFVYDPFSPVPGARLYKTGDLARWRSDGNLEYMGRSDWQVKLRGYRIEPGEIESVLRAHPSVGQAAVVVRELMPGDRRLVAYVVAQRASISIPEELRRYLLTQLPQHMVPSAILLLDELPLTPNGKIDRNQLPMPVMRDALLDHETAPQTSVEERVASAFKRVLGLDHVDGEDNFFELGGHSLLLMSLRNEIHATCGHNVSLVDLLQNASVKTLTRFLESMDSSVTVDGAAKRGRQRRNTLSRRSSSASRC